LLPEVQDWSNENKLDPFLEEKTFSLSEIEELSHARKPASPKAEKKALPLNPERLRHMESPAPFVEEKKETRCWNIETRSTKRKPIMKEDETPLKMASSSSQANKRMESFPSDQVSDWKHVLYNLLVESHNNPEKKNLLQPCSMVYNGRRRDGFSVNSTLHPKKKLAELYAYHVRKANLCELDPESNLVIDLYKYYLRSAYQLMTKYFQKVGSWVYLYEDVPLFVPNSSLAESKERLRLLETRQRKKMKKEHLL